MEFAKHPATAEVASSADAASTADITVNHDVAAEARRKASAFVSRADVDNLRDDPEAKAAFLATFSAEEEKSILRKVDKRFILLTGLMYLIKSVSDRLSIRLEGVLIDDKTRSIRAMPPTSRFYKPESLPTF